MPSIQVTGQLVDPTTGVEGSADIRIASLINYGHTTKKSISHKSTDASGNYDFQLVYGKHLILVKFDGEQIYNRIGYAVVGDITPDPIDLIQLINLSDENPPSELTTELQQLREDILNDIVDTSAQVLENAGYQGEWISGTSTALKGETWQVNGRYYVALKNTSVEPINDNDNWREDVTTDYVTTAQNDIVGGTIFKGSNGETVEGGDVVPVGTTHLRVLVGGKPTIVAMSPVASGLVSLLTESGATIGANQVSFTSTYEINFSTLNDAVNYPLLNTGQSVKVRERSFGNGGGGVFDAVLTSSVTPNGYDIIQSSSNPTLSLKLRLAEALDLSVLGFDETKTSSEISAIISHGCSLVRDNKIISEMTFPAGNFDADFIDIDIDRRGVKVLGAGQDNTVITSKVASGPSLVVRRVDPRDRSRDRLHDYIEIGDFTIDGDLVNRGASAATKCVVQANYCTNRIKSIGHLVSNMDVCGLVSKYQGHTEARSDGVNFTDSSLRFRNNAIKASGRVYTNGHPDHPTSRAFVCDDGATETVGATSIGQTVITLLDASGIEQYDRVEVGDSPTDVKWIVGKSGNDITLDSGLENARASGALVRLPVISNSFTGTIETGRVDIKNAIAFTMDATYQEESRVLLRGYLPGFTLSCGSNAQQSPAITIDNVDRRSSINLIGNTTSFSIVMNLFDRGGGQTTDLDLYNMPEIRIEGNTRAASRISINGVEFNYINVTRNYDYDAGDRYQTDFEFSGLYTSAAALATVTGLSLYMNASANGFDAYNFDLSSSCRRAGSANVRAGIMKRVGGVSTDGAINTPDTVKTATSYTYSANNGNRVDVLFSGSATTATIRYLGEQSGGDTTKFVTRGVISHQL